MFKKIDINAKTSILLLNHRNKILFHCDFFYFIGNLQIFHKGHVYFVIYIKKKGRKINMIPRKTKIFSSRKSQLK